jgi:hypothetical protein
MGKNTNKKLESERKNVKKQTNSSKIAGYENAESFFPKTNISFAHYIAVINDFTATQIFHLRII